MKRSMHVILTRHTRQGGVSMWREHRVAAVEVPPFIIYDDREVSGTETPVYVMTFSKSKLEIGRFHTIESAIEAGAHLAQWEGVNWASLPSQGPKESDSAYIQRALNCVAPLAATQKKIRDFLIRRQGRK